MSDRHYRERLKNIIGPSLVLLLWWWGSKRGLWSSFVVPSPGEAAEALRSMAMDGTLALHALSSLKRILAGFLIALASGIPLGVLSGLFPVFNRQLSSTTGILNYVPPLALFPLMMLWFGIGEASKVGIISLASFFPIYLNCKEGVRSVNPDLVDAARSCGASPWRVFLNVVFPCSIPGIVTGMRLGLSYGWRSLAGAELVASTSGLGFLVHKAEVYSRSDVMIATLIAMGMMGALLDRAMCIATMENSTYMNRLRRG